MQLIYFGQKPNEITILYIYIYIYIYAAKSRRRKKLDTDEVFAETTRNEKFQKDIT
jgi:hypothetical protein